MDDLWARTANDIGNAFVESFDQILIQGVEAFESIANTAKTLFVNLGQNLGTSLGIDRWGQQYGGAIGGALGGIAGVGLGFGLASDGAARGDRVCCAGERT
jgi:hypothetical protein